LCLGPAVAPAVAGDDFVALYQADWAGLPAARIRLTLHDGPDGYRDEIAIGSEGLAHLLSRFRGTAVAAGRLAGQGPEPVRFDADYDLRKRRDRKLRMTFIARSGGTVAERGPADTSRKKELAEEFRRNVIDPLSAFAAIKAAVRRGETSFAVPVYDGARRFDTIVRVLPRDLADPGIHLAMTLRPIAGFKGGTSEDGDPDDAPRPVSLTLSDDARLAPLELSVPIWYLPLDVTLLRMCEAGTACDW